VKTKLSAAFLCALACAAFAVAAATAGNPAIGFAEDATKYAADGGEMLFTEMNTLGTTTNRVAVFWDATQPATIQDQVFLDRMIPVAAKHGVQIVFAIYPKRAVTAPTTPAAVDQFCNYAVQVMQRYPYVRKVIVGNEPNQPRFWQPIWTPQGKPASPAAMEAVLASCYDKLKAADPSLDVIGVGLSPRGNDDPHAPSNSSMSPVRWIKALGDAYRASGRNRPLFDEWSWHCYPNRNPDDVEAGYPWPNTGCVNAARVKLALWDAFNGTGQPTFAGPYAASTTGQTLFGDFAKMFVDETGWQVDTQSRPGYLNSENVPTIDETTQALDYEKLVHLANCEPALSAFHIFHEIDEADRGGFQSGVLRATGEERPSAASGGSQPSALRSGAGVTSSASVGHAISSDAGACTSPIWSRYGSFWYSSTAVVPVYDSAGPGQLPYSTKSPYASLTGSGGGRYVTLQAGEGFSYTLTFTKGGKKAQLYGAAPRTIVTVKVPPGFAKGSLSVKLTAEANAARTSTVKLSL
jgi:hypothetical protein